MSFDTPTILQALAPGVALSSMIFYYGNLQSRMIFTVNTIRRLNEEARALREAPTPASEERARSIRWQVEFLNKRFEGIHQAILFVYGGFFSVILTVFALFAVGVFQIAMMKLVALTTFALGFLCMGVATLISSHEIRLSHQTIVEDIKSSHPLETPPSATRAAVRSVLMSRPSVAERE